MPACAAEHRLLVLRVSEGHSITNSPSPPCPSPGKGPRWNQRPLLPFSAARRLSQNTRRPFPYTLLRFYKNHRQCQRPLYPSLDSPRAFQEWKPLLSCYYSTKASPASEGISCAVELSHTKKSPCAAGVLPAPKVLAVWKLFGKVKFSSVLHAQVKVLLHCPHSGYARLLMKGHVKHTPRPVGVRHS